MTKETWKAAIAADPSNLQLRRVYCDWLEEQGDPNVWVERILARGPLPAESSNIDVVWQLPHGTAAAVAAKYPWPPYTSNHRQRAESLVQWVQTHWKALQKKAEKIRQEEKWLQLVKMGDAEAMLKHPETRSVITLLAQGERPRWGKTATGYTSSRKAIAKAKALMLTRLQRRADRKVAEQSRKGTPNRWAIRWLAKLRTRAVRMGEEYHSTVRKLYQSKFGEVLYGRGGQETVERDRYSKSWHNNYGAARNLNGGARLDSETRPTCVILENFRGTEVARLPLK